MKNIILNEIKKICPSEVYETGFADLSGLLHTDFKAYPYGISLVRKLDDSIIDKIVNGPTIEYFELYHSINSELNDKVTAISAIINKAGIKAYPVKATVADNEMDSLYSETLRYKISHKMTATRAGLGWIGKTDLLITKRFGPRVRLATILTSEPVSETGNPIEKSQCGNCSICVQKCPASASNGKLWSKEIDRDEFYNPVKCMNYCRAISYKLLNEEISICGICVSVCPQGRAEPAEREIKL